MSDIKWTSDQRTIIDARNCNILVSAAAGSGKTAVLVERILQRIVDKKEPVNVDQFLVVTFTKAAAAQMKERLRRRLEKELESQPDNEHLQRQIGLISSAHISTIHSFCNYVIQNYFHRIGLDPSFRQGTQTEIDLIRTEVFTKILEEEYEEGKDDFVDLADMSELNRRDEGIEVMVNHLYQQAMAQPFPMQFLDKMERFLIVETKEEWEQSDMVRCVMQEAKEIIGDIVREQQEVYRLCMGAGGPRYYETQVLEIGDYCEQLLAAEAYDRWHEILTNMTFGAMRKKKDETVDEDIRIQVMERRNECKKRLQSLAKERFCFSSEESLRDLHAMRGKVRTLLRLTRRLHEAFTKEKRERNIVDFNDLEQLAISILLVWDDEKMEYVRTEAACELAEHFVEIMIDEYQDSNRVQEALLHSVSRDGLADFCPNIFMVGDVKQSIYRFRGGCPQLFAEKLDSYSLDDGSQYRRLDLHQNFRSREVVLEGTNTVFQMAMHRDIGGVEYDERAHLHVGRQFPQTELPTAKQIDVYAIIGNQDSEAEGYLIAQKIRAMVEGEEPLYVYDVDGYRHIEYRDIVILVLAHSQGQTIYDALAESGVPVVMERTQGFFETREIALMVSMLRIIDNPHQDIPLATVLLGPMFSFSEEELAAIRIETRDTDLYDALCCYEKADELREKIERFFQILERLRNKVTYATVAELVEDIYDETGIYEAVMMMKDGIQRTANMDSLMEQARQFDGTTYHGLYKFVRYLEQIEKQTEEMGEVNLSGEEENVVRIMTIHKSKGLEFPVGIVAGMGRKLNLPHTDFISIHPDMGIAAPVIDNQERTKKKNFYTQYINDCNKRENVGECIRKLYVAMTRAEEKLILVGCTNKTEAKKLDYEGRRKMNTMFDMVLPAVRTPLFAFHEVEREDLLVFAERDMLQDKLDDERLYNFDTSICYDESIHEYLSWMEAYDISQPEPLPVKVSVSDLKVQSMEEMDIEDFTILTHEEEEEEMPIPAFMSTTETDSQAKQGAAYGTIWHQVMATIDFTKITSKEAIASEIERLVVAGRLREDEKKVLNEERLYTFFCSPLGQAMCQAAKEGTLHREQPFVMGQRACDIFADRSEQDTILVQGIIDGYYETEKGIVLMDYKTDSLRQGEENKLIDRYKTQMDLYREALERMTGKSVVQCLLYSFSLGKEIVLI